MKQLFIRDEPLQIFFLAETTNQQIKNWIGANLDNFNLNEEHSCTVEVLLPMKTVWVIRGDEDLVEVSVKTITPKGTW